ncbi:MAG: excinuclease ABC subunit A, partial [Enterococcus hulanensis]
PRMRLYMQKNMEINNIYRKYADEKNHAVFSVDESFLDVTDSLKLYGCETADQLARLIQIDVWRSTGIYTTVGIGDNPWLAKAALDLYSKHNRNMRAEIRYEDVPNKLWNVQDLTEFCGIAKRTSKRLTRMGIKTGYDLAHADYWRLKTQLGIVGTELYAKAWGIDRSFLGQKYTSKSKSIGNSQVLNKDYTRRDEIETVIKEMSDQVATRLRRSGAKTECVSLWIGFSMGYIDYQNPDKHGFHQQMKLPLTNSSKEIAEALLLIFDRHYRRQDIRNIGVNCSKLTFTNSLQLNIFEEPQKQVDNRKIDYVVDTIRKKYGFKAIVHGTSMMPGARARDRSSLVAGHAGGMSGIESEPHGKAN